MQMKLLIWVITLIIALIFGKGRLQSEHTEDIAVPTTEYEQVETQEDEFSAVEDSIFDDEMQHATVPAPPEIRPPHVVPPSVEPSTKADESETEPEVVPTLPEAPSGGATGEVEPDLPPQIVPDKPSAAPTQPSVEQETESEKEPVYVMTEFEKYQAMSPKEQEEYMKSFESIEAFFVWYEQVKAEHDAARPTINVGDGNINLDEVLGGGNK